jgi:hypothetical protein
MTVKKSIVVICSLVGFYQRFWSEGGGGTFLRNIDSYLQDYTALQPRRPESTIPNI